MDSPRPPKKIIHALGSPLQLIFKLVLFLAVLSLLFFAAGKFKDHFSDQPDKGANPPLAAASVIIGGNRLKVELATTTVSQYRGLSYRTSLCPDCGMLFVFSKSADEEFVMRNMEFPLDIIFINNNKITRIDSDLKPEGQNPKAIYDSQGKVNWVLEVNGGYAASHGLKIGDDVRISSN